MSIPFICQTATTHDAAASPSVAISAAMPTLVVAGLGVDGLRRVPVDGESGGESVIRHAFLGFLERGCCGLASGPVEVLCQRLERAVPVAGQRGQELLRHLHRRRTEPVPHPAPLAGFGRHQAGLGQQGQVLGDRLPRDRQPIGQVRGRRRAARRPARPGWRGGSGRPGR